MAKRIISALLIAVMLVAVCSFGVSADGPSVTVTVTKGSANLGNKALLTDGDRQSAATAFSSSTMFTVENTGFKHTDGVNAAVECSVEFVVDLGSVQTIGGVYMDCFLDSESMIAVPSVKMSVSADGVDYYDIAAGATLAAAANATEKTVITLSTDTARIAAKVRYIRVNADFKNGWIFVTEIGTLAPKTETTAAMELGEALACTFHKGTNPGVGVYDKDDGVIDISDNSDSKWFKNSQIIKAAYDESKDAYKIIYSKVNPWPDGHTGTEQCADGEIFVNIVTGGNLQGKDPDDKYSGLKWIARGLTEGDWIVLDKDASTIRFYPAAHEFKTEAPEVKPVNKNVALGATYTTALPYRQGGADVNWAYSADKDIAYPDEGGVTLTDGVIANDDDGYHNDAWYGLHGKTPDAIEKGYTWVTLDLGKSYDLNKISVFVGSKKLGGGISAPTTVTFLTSNDGENFTELEVVDSAALDNEDANALEVSTTKAVNARYIEVRMVKEGWVFVCEVEAYAMVNGSVPAVKPVIGEKLPLWVTHIDEIPENTDGGEGTGIICTVTDLGGPWWMHVAFAPVAGEENVYKIIGISNGMPDGKGEKLDVPEGGFIYTINRGNDYPSLGAGYEGKPNYTSEGCNASCDMVANWNVGDMFLFENIRSIDASNEGKTYYEEWTSIATVATYTPGTPGTGDAGLVMIVLLAVISAFGAAVVVKSRK